MCMNLEVSLYNNLGENEIEQIKEILDLSQNYDTDDTIEFILDNFDEVKNDIEDILNENDIYLNDYL